MTEFLLIAWILVSAAGTAFFTWVWMMGCVERAIDRAFVRRLIAEHGMTEEKAAATVEKWRQAHA